MKLVNPLISVIVPVYCVEKFIDRCICSIINQTYKNLEIILVDDGSTDNCGVICDKYKHIDNRIIVIHKKNGGLASARNAGLSIANGEYIAFVDGDDCIDKNYYEMLFFSIDDADICISGYKLMDEDGKYITKNTLKTDRLILGTDNNQKLDELIKTSSFGFVWNKLYKKDLIKNIYFENLTPREDIIFNLCLLKRIKKINLIGNYSGYIWLQRNGSITHNSNISNINKTLKIGERLFEILELSNSKNMIGIYNHIMKVLISDNILVDITNNFSLTKKEKISYIKEILNSSIVKNYLYLQKNDTLYNKFLVLSTKIGFTNILLFISNKLVKRGNKNNEINV